MNESENRNLSFDNLPRSVAELHEKIDRLTGMFEQFISSAAIAPVPEIMTVEDASAMLCKSVSTIYAMTSEHRIPYRKQGNKLYFLRSEITSWLMDSVVPKDTPKRRRKQHEDKNSVGKKRQPDENPSECDGTSAQIPQKNCGDAGGEDTTFDNGSEPYSIENRIHSRTGATIFAVLFSKEIEAAGERKFVQTARDFNGYWSDFGNGGYIFNSRQEAENFAKAIAGKKES